MGAVELLVRDLDGMTRYYHDGVGLDVLDARGATVVLGSGAPAVVLRQEKDLPPAAPRSAGLYHTAILFPDQAALAASLLSVARLAPGTFTGSADHLFSEAFYFSDPEGNGLELYRDRPREQWAYDTAGTLQTATLPLDPNQFLARHLDASTAAAAAGSGASPDAEVGHVHLQVGDIPTARAFYVDVLGFDVTMDLGSALFVSAGGYHHHLAMNIWGTRGAGPRAASLGLGQLALEVPSRDDVAALADRVRRAGLRFSDDGRTLTVADPWGTQVRVTAAA
jgi:catechol 2,3-dioxygenase